MENGRFAWVRYGTASGREAILRYEAMLGVIARQFIFRHILSLRQRLRTPPQCRTLMF
ncbi:hypothetical protein KIN20_021619 [Parelaphostrongylus tenuis]|uniref:Uncharacterized protein n=1 Tax=Parelaphostrongylus tenuis TaxID=148309 RepID=A0AAD5MT10_PARTN|nr:hypothetical protein KIN20_021619 [Parelaphostrongylus tenuis]